MYLSFGTFTHVQNDPAVRIDSAAIYNSRNVIELIRYTWTIRGVLHGTNQANLLANMVLLEAAYKFNDGQSLILYEDDQATIFQQLPTGTALGGTRVVVPPRYPIGEGAEGSTFRSYEIMVQADYPNTNNNILEWEDSVEIANGGPRRVVLDTLVGAGQEQITQQQMPSTARQTGHARGMFAFVPPAPPFDPNNVLFPLHVRTVSPKRVGTGQQYRDWVTTWDYQFLSVGSMAGVPLII